MSKCQIVGNLMPRLKMFGLAVPSAAMSTRVKSGIFGQTAKFGQRPCLFHISNSGIKIELTEQTVIILIRRLIGAVLSGFTLLANACPNLPGVRIYPTLP